MKIGKSTKQKEEMRKKKGEAFIFIFIFIIIRWAALLRIVEYLRVIVIFYLSVFLL